MSNKENQSKKVKVNGKWIEVSEEVYRAYMRDEWREAQREYRSKKCRNADGTVCRKDCKTCPHYLEGEGLTGATLSLDAFVTEDGYDTRKTRLQQPFRNRKRRACGQSDGMESHIDIQRMGGRKR